MIGNVKFWVALAVFQIVFGMTVFAVTRQYYIGSAASGAGNVSGTADSSFEWLDTLPPADAALLDTAAKPAASQDPLEISRQADTYFSNKQYAMAADAYRRVLAFGPANADIHNNLGLTLHYLGQPEEALRTLAEGVALDATNQRIWLTSGFVNSQLGNLDEARKALNTAVGISADSEVGQAAAEMLGELPD